MSSPIYLIDQQEARCKLESIYSELFSAIDNELLTFKELSDEIFRRKNELTSLILRGALHYEVATLEESIRSNCVKCKKELTRHRQKTSILQSINGILSFSRNYYYCRECKIGFCPSDWALQVLPRKLQFDVQWKILEYVVKLPYDEAIKELKTHYNIDANKKIVHQLVQSASAGLTITKSIKDKSKLRDQLIALRNGSRRRVVVVIGIDGAHIPIRSDHVHRKGKRGKGFWREAKGIRVYAIVDKRIHHILSWHQIQDADGIEESLNEILMADLIPSDIARICVCADGAEWIWNRVKAVFPDAKLVLDYYHCSEHIHKLAAMYFENDKEKIKWINMSKKRLFSGEVLILVEELKNMISTDEDTNHKIKLLASYLEERAEMTFYTSFKKGGYPIGSGGIESSNKYVCHRRMKLSGAWWKEKMANAMLALRSAYVNGALPDIFNLYVQKKLVEYFPYQT